MVLGSEVRREQPQPGEMHPSRSDRFDHCGQPPSDPGDGNPIVRGAFGETELVEAEGEHGGMSAVQIQLPVVDFSEVRQEIGLDAM